MGNTSSQPELSQREKQQVTTTTTRPAKTPATAREIPDSFDSVPPTQDTLNSNHSVDVWRRSWETRSEVGNADDIAASSQLLLESLRSMGDGAAVERRSLSGDVGRGVEEKGKRKGVEEKGEKSVKRRKKGVEGPVVNGSYGVGADADGGLRIDDTRKGGGLGKKRKRGAEDKEGNGRREKKQRNGDESKRGKGKRSPTVDDMMVNGSHSVNGEGDHAVQVDMVTGELPAHMRKDGRARNGSKTEKGDATAVMSAYSYFRKPLLEGMAFGTSTKPQQSTTTAKQSTKKSTMKKNKYASSHNQSAQSFKEAETASSEGIAKKSTDRRQAKIAIAPSEQNGGRASPDPANDTSTAPLKGIGRKFSHVKIPPVRPTEHIKAVISQEVLPTAPDGSDEEGAADVTDILVGMLTSSQRKKDRPEKNIRKRANATAYSNVLTDDDGSNQASVRSCGASKGRRGLTPRWTAVNQETPTQARVMNGTSQDNPTSLHHPRDEQKATQKRSATVEKKIKRVDRHNLPGTHDAASAAPRLNSVAEKKRRASSARAGEAKGKQQKCPKSREFIYDSDLSGSEGPSKDVASTKRKKHVAVEVTPMQNQSELEGARKNKRKGSLRRTGDEIQKRASPRVETDPVDHNHDTGNELSYSSPKRKQKRKRTDEDDEVYEIPPDTDSEHSQTSPRKAPKRAQQSHTPQTKNREKPEETNEEAVEKVKGAFSDQELNTLKRYFNRYKLDHSLDQRAMNDRIQNTERNGESKAFWDAIATLLPNRPRKSLQRFCRRQWHNYQSSGSWSLEDDEMLRDAYAFKPNKWVYIGGVVGRRPEDCRDRWRNVVKLGDRRREGGWTEEEEERLRKAVAECAKAMAGARRNSGSSEEGGGDEETMGTVDWNVVSDKMGGTRSRQQCADKWKILMRDAVTVASTAPTPTATPTVRTQSSSSKKDWRKRRASKRYKKMSAGDKYDILKAVERSGTINVNNIRWSIVRDVLGGSNCIWETTDLEYAFGIVKRKAGVEGQEAELGLQKVVKRMKRYLKEKFGKEAVKRRFLDTKEGRRISEFGWSAKKKERRKSILERLEERGEEGDDGDEEIQQDDVRDDDGRDVMDKPDEDGETQEEAFHDDYAEDEELPNGAVPDEDVQDEDLQDEGSQQWIDSDRENLDGEENTEGQEVASSSEG